MNSIGGKLASWATTILLEEFAPDAEPPGDVALHPARVQAANATATTLHTLYNHLLFNAVFRVP